MFPLLSVLTLTSSQTGDNLFSPPLVHTHKIEGLRPYRSRWPHCFFSFSLICLCCRQVCSASCPTALIPMWWLPALILPSVFSGSKPVGKAERHPVHPDCLYKQPGEKGGAAGTQFLGKIYL